jgi:hypothetical protein
MAQPTRPEWIQNLQQRNAKFADMYWAQREHVLQDGAIPAKYKILMTMIVDAITAHADGVANIAIAPVRRATEAELTKRWKSPISSARQPTVTAINAYRPHKENATG